MLTSPFAPRAMVPHPRYESCGNRVLLALVDGRGTYADTSAVEPTVLVALQHFGLPFRAHDLANGPLTRELLDDCAAVVVAQARLGERLSLAETELLAAAVSEAGLGLVNFDGELRLYKPPLMALFGLEVDDLPMASDRLQINSGDHYITRTLDPGSTVSLKRPVSCAQIKRVGRHVTELAQLNMGKDQLIFARHHVPGTAYAPDQYPAALAAVCGRGRAVQFACSVRLWHQEFLGHTMGLDGLFRRALVWAARKPFAARAMPPLVSIRIDDGIGRHDFRYVEVMNAHGHHPLVSCFLDGVPDEMVPFMRSKWQSGQVDWDAHGFEYYDLLPFDFGVGEPNPEEMAARFGRVDEWYDSRELVPPRTAYFHWGEVGVGALSQLKARGRTFVFSPYHLGQLKWERLFPNWWPYGLNSLFYDCFPEDPDMYNIGAGLPRHLMAHDVLTGCTRWSGESPINDMTRAAERTAQAVRLATDSGFFSEIVTHEQKLGVLSLEEIDQWLTRLEQQLERSPVRLVGHEHAAEYTRARDETWITSASARDGGACALCLDGEARVPLELAVFDDDGDGVRQRWETVPAFRGKTEIDLT